MTEEAIPSELLGMKKADQELLEKYNLVKCAPPRPPPCPLRPSA